MDRLERRLTQLQGFNDDCDLSSYLGACPNKRHWYYWLRNSSDWSSDVKFFSFLIDFGPNTTTFAVPAEVFPTMRRTTGHGISAAGGKKEAAITTFFFLALLLSIGVKGILEMPVVVIIAGAPLTLGLRESKKA